MTPRESELDRFEAKARTGSPCPVARVFPSDMLTPVALFRRMRASGRESFLLESVEGGETLARYTFLGCGPAARLTVTGADARLERDGRTERVDGDFLHALEELAVQRGFQPDPDLPPLASGAVGYLGYDAVRLFERIPDRHPRVGRMPDGLFLLFDAVLAFDHPRQRLLLLTTLRPDASGGSRRAALDAAARLDRLETFLTSPDPPPADPPRGPSLFRSDAPKQKFVESVERAREAIFAGDAYQVVVSQRWSGVAGVDPFEIYRALRTLNPSPYLFYVETREGSVFGASPEMLVRCRGREAETRPIAGTARRGATPAEDEALREALLADPKERAEHVMLVDLARNDLGRVCEIGSVRVARYAVIEKYSHVQHIVSEVRGRLARGRSAVDALAACFPAGTLTGAPKIRAMELIDELESVRRGVYGGVVGYVDCAGDLDVAIAIRMAVVEDGVCRVQAGAGIVADSIPENEYREAESKAAAIFRAVELARERSDPAAGSTLAQLPSRVAR
jgi:anthranilate synthase component 1